MGWCQRQPSTGTHQAVAMLATWEACRRTTPNVPANHLQPSLSRSSTPAGAHLLQARASTLHQPRSSRLQQVVQMRLPCKLARHLRLSVLQRTARRHKAVAAGLREERERWRMRRSAMKAPTMSAPAESCCLTSHASCSNKKLSLRLPPKPNQSCIPP